MRSPSTNWRWALLAVVVQGAFLNNAHAADELASPLPAGAIRRLGTTTGEEILGLAFSPDGKLLAVGSEKTAWVLDVATGKYIRSMKEGMGATGLTFAPDGKSLAGTVDHSILVWDVATGDVIHNLTTRPGRPPSVVFSPDGRTIGGHSIAKVWEWEAASGKLVRMWSCKPRENNVTSLTFASDGKLFAMRNGYGYLRRWDVAAEKEIQNYPGHEQGEGGWWTLVSPDGKTMASMSAEGAIHFWDLSTGKLLSNLDVHHQDERCAWFAPNSKALASVDRQVIRLWDVPTGKQLHAWSAPRDVTVLAFAPDGKTFVSDGKGALLVWDVFAAGPRTDQPREAELSSLWDDLGQPGPIRGHRAVCMLVQAAPHTVPFLRQCLAGRPGPPEPERLVRLIAELDDARFEVREEASRQLFELGESSERALRRALDQKPSLEMRYRLTELVEKVEGLEPTPEAKRWQRAIEILEYVGNSEAKDLLEQLVKELPPRQSQEAREALDRLERRTSHAP